MSRLEEVKKRKPFAIWDLLVYGLLIALILTLFAVFVFGGSGKSASGIEIVYVDRDNTVVYTYRYDSLSGEIAKGWEERIHSETEEDGTVVVTVYTDDEGKNYNVIAIDPVAKTATMRDANCSFRKDCVNMSGVSSERDVVVCLPHHLKVQALGGRLDDLEHPSVG